MRLVLAIEASSATYAVALGPLAAPGSQPAAPGQAAGQGQPAAPGQAGRPTAHLEAHRHDPDFAGVGGLVSAALASVGRSSADIGLIGVDVGPGNLTSVRAAVAYANGLAFSLGVMVCPVMSLELMAVQAGKAKSGPVLCLRKGDGGDAYAGLFGHGEPDLRYGQLRAVLPAMAGSLDEVSVAGAHRELAAVLLPQVRVHDTGVDSPDVATLYQMLTGRGDDTRLVPAASAVNEGSREFHGHAAVHT